MGDGRNSQEKKIMDAIIRAIDLCVKGVVDGLGIFVTTLANALIKLSDTVEKALKLFKKAMVRAIKELSRLLSALLQFLILIFPLYAIYIYGVEQSSLLVRVFGVILIISALTVFIYAIRRSFRQEKSEQRPRTGSSQNQRILVISFCLVDSIILIRFISLLLTRYAMPKSIFLKLVRFVMDFDWTGFFRTSIVPGLLFLENFITKNKVPLIICFVIITILMFTVGMLRISAQHTADRERRKRQE